MPILPNILHTNATGVNAILFTINGICPIILENTLGTAVFKSVPSMDSFPPEKSESSTDQRFLSSPFTAYALISAFAFAISPNIPGSKLANTSPIPLSDPANPPPSSL